MGLISSFLAVHYPFRCTFENVGDCALGQGVDDDEDWHLVTADADSNFGGVDHTTLSGRELSMKIQKLEL